MIELGEQGKSRWQIAVALGCSRKSLYAWMKIHPEFAEAMEEAQFPALAWWEDAGQAGLMLKGFNANLYAYQMKNRFREHYSDKVDVKHGIGEPDQQNPEERELTNLDLARRVAFMLHQAVETKRTWRGSSRAAAMPTPSPRYIPVSDPSWLHSPREYRNLTEDPPRLCPLPSPPPSARLPSLPRKTSSSSSLRRTLVSLSAASALASILMPATRKPSCCLCS